MRIPPPELSQGIGYLIDAHNELRAYVLRQLTIPVNGYQETESGLLPPPRQDLQDLNALAATGLICSEDLEAAFEQGTSGSVANAWVATNHVDQLELFSSLKGTEPRWYIANSGGSIWYISNSANVFGGYSRVGTPSPGQGSAPEGITLSSFPNVLSYDNGTTVYTVYYQQGVSGSATYQDLGFSVTLGWNATAGEWMSDGESGSDTVSSSFCDPTGGPSSGGVTVSFLGF